LAKGKMTGMRNLREQNLRVRVMTARIDLQIHEQASIECMVSPTTTTAHTFTFCNLRSSADEHYGYNTGQIDTSAAQANDAPPPAYSETLGHITNETEGFGTNASVAGTVKMFVFICMG
jgi:hypothetical protein